MKRPSQIPPATGKAAAVVLACLALLSLLPSAEENKLSIYTPQKSFSVSIKQQDGQTYVSLPEILAPLGVLTGKVSGLRWKLRFNEVEAEFKDGSSQAKIGTSDVALPSPFHIDNGRMTVPLSSLAALLPGVLRVPVDVHESARRLFIAGVVTRFSVVLHDTPSESLVLTFSAPVNPSIATEPGKLRMVFQRDPLLHASPENVTFNAKSIASLAYQEQNGIAEITLSGDAPLIARFRSDRKAITVAPVSQIATPAPPPAAQTQPATAPVSPVLGQPPASAPPPPVQPAVLLDAGHGGQDRGASLTASLTEKDVTLDIARRLHHQLQTRGIPSLLLRDSDINLTTEQRAVQANISRAQVYLSIHAAGEGVGVRLYTALLPPEQQKRGPFLPWDRAQAPFFPASQNLAGAISNELSKSQIPVREFSAPLRPLNNVASIALAIEVAPPTNDINQLGSTSYQEQISVALATAVAQILREGPAR